MTRPATGWALGAMAVSATLLLAAPAAAAVPVFGPSLAIDAATARPSTIDGGSDFGWERMRWSSWTASRAAGNGTFYKVCKYDAGCRHSVVKKTYRVRVRLSRPRTCGGRTTFTRLRSRFAGSRPHGYPRTQTSTYVCADDGYLTYG